MKIQRSLNGWIDENIKLEASKYEIWSVKNHSGKPWICQTYLERERAEKALTMYKSAYISERFELREVYE
jgi:hypothetical protein